MNPPRVVGRIGGALRAVKQRAHSRAWCSGTVPAGQGGVLFKKIFVLRAYTIYFLNIYIKKPKILLRGFLHHPPVGLGHLVAPAGEDSTVRIQPVLDIGPTNPPWQS